MPKTLLEKVVFTIVMATMMVYGMIVYNVALNTGGVTNATFLMALHEMPIMVPVACILEFFVVEKLATALAFTFMRPTDRPQFITYAISLMIVAIMCPVMSLWQPSCLKSPALACGCTPGAAICPWPCAGRCSTAARSPGSSSGWCSAAARLRTPPPELFTLLNRYRGHTGWTSRKKNQAACAPDKSYKFYISDIPAIYTVWIFSTICLVISLKQLKFS